MGRKLVDPTRSKAIVNDAWEQVKVISGGISPSWPYMGVCQIVDTLLADNPALDGRDIGDAIVLCYRLDEHPTKVQIINNMKRVNRGREGVTGYR